MSTMNTIRANRCQIIKFVAKPLSLAQRIEISCKQIVLSLSAIVWLTIGIKNVSAQCDNTAQWPAGTVSIACGNNTINNGIFAGEYSLTSGYQDNSTLIFSSSVPTDYITIRRASDNAVIAHGVIPLTINYVAAHGDLKVNINTNAACATQTVVRISSVVVLCGCSNTLKYPVLDINVNLGINTLSNNQWAGDYNVTRGYLHGALCIYSSSVGTDFITLRKASDNTILATGISPVALNYEATMGSIEMHINTNAACGIANVNRTTTLLMEYGIYKGGVADGYSDASFDQGANPALTLYRGGNDDGFVTTCFDQGPNPALTMYRGGNDDGFVTTCFDQGPNPILAMYRGGNDDGFVTTCFDQGPNAILALYRGGNDDGFTLSCYEQCDGTVTRWFGNISIDWHNFQNWECGILPTLTSDVVIPSGAFLFPTVSANDEIRSLLLQTSASLNILNPAELKLNGL